MESQPNQFFFRNKLSPNKQLHITSPGMINSTFHDKSLVLKEHYIRFVTLYFKCVNEIVVNQK